MADVSSPATLAPAHVHVDRPNVVSVGTIIWLASELMFFAGLFAMYFTHRSVNADLWPAGVDHLNIPFSLTNTIILVLSSVTAQFGVFAAERLQPRRTGGIFAFKQHLTGIGLLQSGNDAQQGGLAATGGTEQGNQFTGGKIEADIVERDKIAKGLVNVLDFNTHDADSCWGVP